MRRFFAPLAFAATTLAFAAAATAAPTITPIAAEKGKTVRVAGKLEAGAPLASLDWAWKSSMACFPATQQANYTGNHVFFQAELPPKSEMYVTIIPKDPKVNLSGYAYSVAPGKVVLPPDVASCVSCEAEAKWDRPKRGKTQDHTRVLPRVTAIGNPYSVLIGVTAPKEVTAGEFEVEVTIK
ncbi:hypothetical protein L6V77_02560 [Myxococcota bacterium]|nr:hypothetical protein [Myxococcota bacterium]